MKKFIAFVIALLLVAAMGSAFAFDWSYAPKECAKYKIKIEKYAQNMGDIGVNYKISPDAVAHKGERVYFTIEAEGEDGELFEIGELIAQDLVNIKKFSNGLYTAVVSGPRPAITYKIEEKTDVRDLYYENTQIDVAEDRVVIGDFMFTRSNDGVVTGMEYRGNLLNLNDGLRRLNIPPDDLASGKICMTNDILIQNFGRICNQSKTVKWYVETPDMNDVSELLPPKTGDESVIARALAVLAIAAVVTLAVAGSVKQ